MTIQHNTIHHGNCFDLLPSIPDGSVDAIITDPPYGVLKGHKIETNVDIPRFFAECKRVMKQNAFIAFFGQMPTAVFWLNACMNLFRFRNDVVWCKRQFSAPTPQLPRMHENIYILGGESYFKIKGNYEDIKVPMCEMGLLTESALEINRKALASGQIDRHYKGQGNDVWSGFDSLRHNYESARGREEAKFSTVWSFATHNKAGYINSDNDIPHPTVKPILLLERLVELLTPEPTADFVPLVLDPFAGSGTTAVACQNLNRNFIAMELHEEYVNIGRKRLKESFNLFTDDAFRTE